MSVRIYVMCAGAWKRQKIIGFSLSCVFRQLLASDISTETHTLQEQKVLFTTELSLLPSDSTFNMKVTREWLINWDLVILLYLFSFIDVIYNTSVKEIGESALEFIGGDFLIPATFFHIKESSIKIILALFSPF